jgi:hypothetical protein
LSVPFVSEGAFGRDPFGGGRTSQGVVVSASTFGPDFHQQVTSFSQAKQDEIIKTCTTATYTVVRLAKSCSTAAAYTVVRLSKPYSWWATTSAHAIVRLSKPCSTTAAHVVWWLAKSYLGCPHYGWSSCLAWND